MKPIDWKKLCRMEGIAVLGEAVRIDLADGRSHHITVRDEGDSLELSAIVASARALSGVEDAALATWRRNRTAQIVGFRIDARGRMVGEAWVPRQGLTFEELALHLRSVAAECDRLEYLLTGEDNE
jgi:hypothetical protein